MLVFYGIMSIFVNGFLRSFPEAYFIAKNEVATTVVFVDYARSTEAAYPVAIEQAYAATKWVAEHGASIGVDPSRLVVAGDSVGAIWLPP
jgi:acetyl esterase/lipase